MRTMILMIAWGKELVERQEDSGRETREGDVAVLQENEVFREF